MSEGKAVTDRASPVVCLRNCRRVEEGVFIRCVILTQGTQALINYNVTWLYLSADARRMAQSGDRGKREKSTVLSPWSGVHGQRWGKEP